MATKTDSPVNKSQALRELIRENTGITTDAAIAMMKERGMTVDPNLVYNVKRELKGGSKSSKRSRSASAAGAPAAADAPPGNGSQAARGNRSALHPVEAVEQTKQLAGRLGGLEQLRDLTEGLIGAGELIEA